MISRTTAEFWDLFQRLPTAIQRLAEQKYQHWQQNPFHPSLHFKPLRHDVWSVRINLQYRALAVRRSNDEFLWFWIGSHADYDRLVDRMP